MIYKVFLDTNIVIDFFVTERLSHEDAKELFKMLDENHLYGFVSVCEISTLHAVAMNHDRLTLEGGGHESGDDGGVGVTSCLMRAEHVKEPKRKRRQAKTTLPGKCVLLGGQLAHRVRTDWHGQQIFVLWKRWIRSVYR